MSPERLPHVYSIAGGELFQRIVDDNFEHTESTCMQYMQQILEGVQHMHQQNIVHMDLKPENIVCVDSTGTSIKIIDFGLASKLGKYRKSVLLCDCHTLLPGGKAKYNQFIMHHI